MIMKDIPLVHGAQQLQTKACQTKWTGQGNTEYDTETPFVDSMPDQPHKLNTSYSEQIYMKWRNCETTRRVVSDVLPKHLQGKNNAYSSPHIQINLCIIP